MNDIYSDIAARTGGDIYIGVVGPVRTGKSTLIKRFMETMVIPEIEDPARRERATDELPQSAGGRTIMTTEPKFVPENAVTLRLPDGAVCSVRMIDCVGYIVPSSLGYIEAEAPRMVKTPWFDEEVPFNMAAEIGTQKVITEHATVGVVVTTDGSVTDIPRAEYAAAEARVVSELTALGKPFVVLLNCVEPESDGAKALAAELEAQYGAPVLAVNCLTLSEETIRLMLEKLLDMFPLREIGVETAGWLPALESGHWLRTAVFDAVREAAADCQTVRDVRGMPEALAGCPYIREAALREIALGTGKAVLRLTLDPALFYQILGEETGIGIQSENELFPLLLELSRMKREYERIRPALEEAEATGYGIIMPQADELTLEEPEMIRQGGRYGVRLRASAPSLHIMRAGIQTTVSPIVGSEKQSEELVLYLLREFEENPAQIWESNIFGKSLHELVNEGLHAKLAKMPAEARLKLQETLERVINEGCSGLICFIL
ncbi:MAG: stage IV sporulation protein A [Oscillospiraceae bacterium]|nr:stage IV sporulation protein A [Oscillospiraceae bacterium]